MPSFSEWMREKIGPHWAVVKSRTAARQARHGRLLLPREYDALATEYERTFGVHPWKLSAT